MITLSSLYYKGIQGGLRKTAILTCSLVHLFTCSLVSCSDYFSPEAKGEMSADDNMTEESQVFKGMFGIFNCMQQAGDQAIFLTDTRMNILDVTSNAPEELKNVYNYKETDGNDYADPSCYYKIIIACNDYISKMAEYHKNNFDSRDGSMTTTEVTQTSFKGLLGDAVRIKVWAYYMLGKIYGEAYWFDSPLTNMENLSDVTTFEHCDMEKLTNKCLALLENGIDVDGVHVDADMTMMWYKWFNQETDQKSTYLKYQFMAPPFLLLKAELMSWKCNYEDEESAQADWQWIRDTILKYMHKIYNAETEAEYYDLMIDGRRNYIYGFEDGFTVSTRYSSGGLKYINRIYQPSTYLESDGDGGQAASGSYYLMFYSNTQGMKWQNISNILYSYKDNQRNRLVQYFCPDFPEGGYYLRPSDYAINTLYNKDDIRSFSQKHVMNTISGQPCVSKYYYGYNLDDKTEEYLGQTISSTTFNIFEIQPSIPTFRGHDFQFLLAEAENHLGNPDQAMTLLNDGLNNRFTYPVSYKDKNNVFRSDVWLKKLIKEKGLAAQYTKAAREAHAPKISEGDANACLDTLQWTKATEDSIFDEMVSLSKEDKHMWSPYYGEWYNVNATGIAGSAKGDLYTLDSSLSENEKKEALDWLLAKEHSKEYMAEGKSYSYLCKMAERWSHAGRGDKATAASKMADIIAPKYQASGKVGTVRSSLLNKYFINWTLDK